VKAGEEAPPWLPATSVLVHSLVYLPEVNAQKIRVYKTGGSLAAVIPTGEWMLSSAVAAAREVYVSTWDPYTSGGIGYVQAFAP
jgi:hypothetical protein